MLSLEKETATHSSILAWKIQWTEEPGGLQSMGFKKSALTEHISTDCVIRISAAGQVYLKSKLIVKGIRFVVSRGSGVGATG